ncbi:MAG: MFS transporter [Pseudomonadales bacterium]|nr:MFS transporter [Pseudomonadales bacterium]
MFYGWRVLGALCAVYFLSVGVVFYSFAVVLPTMILDLGWTRGGASVGHAILALTFGVGALVAAMVLARVGARNTLAIGGLLSALGSIVIYFTDTLNQFYLGIAIVGLGISLQSMVPGTQLLTDWFSKRRAISMGLFLSMGGFGAFIAAPAIAYLIESTGDWRIAWLVTAACAGIGSVIVLLFVRDHPSDVGTFADGIDPSIAVEETGDAEKVKISSGVYQSTAQWTTGEAYRTVALWTIVLAAGLAGIGLALNASQSVIHLLDQGLNPVVAGSAVGIVGLFSTGGRLFAGATGDRFDPRFLLAGGLAIELLGIAILNYTDSARMVYVYSILFGIGNGATVVALPALVANYFGAYSYARTIGIVHLILTPFAATASVLAGYVFDYSQSYTGVFLGYAVISVIPVVLVLFMRPPRHPNEEPLLNAG